MRAHEVARADQRDLRLDLEAVHAQDREARHADVVQRSVRHAVPAEEGGREQVRERLGRQAREHFVPVDVVQQHPAPGARAGQQPPLGTRHEQEILEGLRQLDAVQGGLRIVEPIQRRNVAQRQHEALPPRQRVDAARLTVEREARERAQLAVEQDQARRQLVGDRDEIAAGREGDVARVHAHLRANLDAAALEVVAHQGAVARDRDEAAIADVELGAAVDATDRKAVELFERVAVEHRDAAAAALHHQHQVLATHRRRNAHLARLELDAARRDVARIPAHVADRLAHQGDQRARALRVEHRAEARHLRGEAAVQSHALELLIRAAPQRVRDQGRRVAAVALHAVAGAAELAVARRGVAGRRTAREREGGEHEQRQAREPRIEATRTERHDVAPSLAARREACQRPAAEARLREASCSR
jgi:hypothetical protein